METKKRTTKFLRLLPTPEPIILQALTGEPLEDYDVGTYSMFLDAGYAISELCKQKTPRCSKTEVEVYSRKKPATYKEMFGHIGRNINHLCLTFTQIKLFCFKHANMLSSEGSTSFLMKVGKGYVVMTVYYRREMFGKVVWHIEKSDFNLRNVWVTAKRYGGSRLVVRKCTVKETPRYLTKLKDLNDNQRGHIAWRLDHKTACGFLTACRIGRMDDGWGEKTLYDVFEWIGCTPHASKLHASKVLGFPGNWKEKD